MSRHLNEWADFEVPLSDGEAASFYEAYSAYKTAMKKVPLHELEKRGWISSGSIGESMLPLIRNMQQGKAARLFRKSSTADDLLCEIWMSRVASLGKINIATNCFPQFSGLSQDYLFEIARMSVDPEMILRLPSILAENGIILVYERALPGIKLDGAVAKLESGHRLIGISFRYPRLDHFWFTLMHELAHLVLHDEMLDVPHFDNIEQNEKDIIELKANRVAKYSFVKRDAWRGLEVRNKPKDEAVLTFAEQVNVHPAIIAGLIRKEAKAWDRYSEIVNSIDVRSMVFDA